MGTIDNMLALNAMHEKQTSPLERASLEAMLAAAFWWEAPGEAPDALLIAFDQGADYDSPNFGWFKSRHARFVYIDRIVVARRAQGRGLARRLYETLCDSAHTAGHDRIVCEINLEPANPGSIAFHDKLGFAEVGQARLANGKLVSYRERLMVGPD